MLKLCAARTNTPILIKAKAAGAVLALCAAAASLQSATAQTHHVRQEAASRHFTLAQARTIRRSLASRSLTAQTLYVVQLECSDCPDYSAELIDIVGKVSGWAIYSGLVIGYTEEPQSDIGLTLIDAHPNDPAPATLALRDALKAARIPFSVASATKPLEFGKPGTKIVISRVKRF